MAHYAVCPDPILHLTHVPMFLALGENNLCRASWQSHWEVIKDVTSLVTVNHTDRLWLTMLRPHPEFNPWPYGKNLE